MTDDRPIAPNDLVWVAKPMPCCGHTVNDHGTHFVVTVMMPVDAAMCPFCRTIHRQFPAAFGANGRGYPVPLLRRVPPLKELEGIVRREEVPNHG